jgi:hypothetical protein
MAERLMQLRDNRRSSGAPLLRRALILIKIFESEMAPRDVTQGQGQARD